MCAEDLDGGFGAVYPAARLEGAVPVPLISFCLPDSETPKF